MSESKGRYFSWFTRERTSNHPLMGASTENDTNEKTTFNFMNFKFMETDLQSSFINHKQNSSSTNLNSKTEESVLTIENLETESNEEITSSTFPLPYPIKLPSHVKFLPSKRKPSSINNVEPLLLEELSKSVIDISKIKKFSSFGIPDDKKLRAVTWKILLGYLPLNKDNWIKELKTKREEYNFFKKELIINPTELSRKKEEAEKEKILDDVADELSKCHLSNDDHPLSLGNSSIWNQFFKDLELKEQIDRDVKRTHPDLPFFNNENDPNSLKIQEMMKRILFVFAKLNSGINYVQGMNEILAPLIFVFSEDDSDDIVFSDNMMHVEEDAFFCLVSLLSDFRDNFCKQLDATAVGVRAQIESFDFILKSCDYELWIHLKEKVKIDPQLFSFRWITLLLTQEFDLKSILKIWDFLLACEDRQGMLLKLCVSMLLCVRDKILQGDFSSNLKLLQNYPKVSIELLLDVTEKVIA